MIRRFMLTGFCGSIATYLSTTACLAHEGHGHSSAPGTSATHYLSEPYHVLQFAGIVAVILAVGIAGLRWYFTSTAHSRSSAR